MCQRCKNSAHEAEECDVPIDLKGMMKYWSQKANTAKRREREVAWVIKTKGLEELHKAVKKAQLEPTDFSELDGYMTALAEANNKSAATPVPPAAKPIGQTSRALNLKSQEESNTEPRTEPKSKPKSKPKQERPSEAPQKKPKSPQEEEIEKLFELCYPHPLQDTEQPDGTQIFNENLSPRSLTTHQDDVHRKALTVIEARKNEKNGFPPAKQEDFHAIRMGFCESKQKSTVLTNHVIIDKMPSNLWKYSLGGDIPTSVSRKKKKVLIETMIKRMSFLDNNRQCFTYDSNGTFYSCKDLYLLAQAQPQPNPPIFTMIAGPGSRRVATQIPSARSGPQGVDAILNVHLEGADRPSVDMNAFTNACRGTSLETDNDVLEVVNALNAIVAKATSKVTDDLFRTFQIGGNKFFLCSVHTPLGKPNTAVLQVNVGFYSTAKAGMGSGLLNINIATSAFYRPIGVDDYLRRMQSRDNWDISRKEAEGLKGIRVYIKCVRGLDRRDGTSAKNLAINQPERRFRTIYGLGNACNKQEFNWDGEQCTVFAYQKGKYNRNLQFPSLKAVNLGSDKRAEWYAPEDLSILPYQPWSGLVPPSLSTDMINQACRKPLQSVSAIVSKGFQALGITGLTPATNPLGIFGLSIDNKLMAVPSNILNPPSVQYRTKLSSIFSVGIADLKRGQWNLTDKKFFTRAKVAHVHFLYPAGFKYGAFEHDFDQQLHRYIDVTSKPLNVTRGFAPAQCKTDAERAKFNTCLEACSPGKADYLIVFINDYPEKEPYTRFRQFTDKELGVPSLCLKLKKLKNGIMAQQYFGNNAMKMNLRLGGGVNHQIDLRQFLPHGVALDQTIIIGADVTHPGGKCSPGTGSLTALVGTVDPACNIYRGVARPNPEREEMIESFSDMLKELVRAWSEQHGLKLPKYVLYLRDGVSESQYIAVRRSEVDHIHGVFRELATELKIKLSEKDLPQITAIVVTKRHHTRFYENPPKNHAGRDDGSTNTKPGLCVDKDVTHYYYNSFFIQSHAAIKGTARPTHYFVLQDDTESTSDRLQNLIHGLCYTYGRSSGSVSYPTPTYYADRLCDRMRLYFAEWLNGSKRIDHPKPGDVHTSGPSMGQQRTQEDLGHSVFKANWSKQDSNGNPWHSKLCNKTFWM